VRPQVQDGRAKEENAAATRPFSLDGSREFVTDDVAAVERWQADRR
jgi:hypothetical protein